MAEDYEKMKAQKVSKTDTLKKLISSNSNSSSGSAKRTTTAKSSSRKSNTKSTSQRKKTNSGTNSVTGLISELVSGSVNQPKKRGRPKKSSTSTTTNSSQKSQKNSSNNNQKEKNEELNIPVKNAKYMSKSQKKAFKREGKSLILFICFLVVGVFIGYAVTRFLVFPLAFPNDIYAMVEFKDGEKTSADIYLKKDADGSEMFTYESYTELGVKCIAFGKDYSSDYTVTYYYRNDLTKDEEKLNGIEDIDTSKEGIYYAVYSVPALKYKTVTLIRNIIVLRGEDDE